MLHLHRHAALSDVILGAHRRLGTPPLMYIRLCCARGAPLTAALTLALVSMLLPSATPATGPVWLCCQDMLPAQVPMLHMHALAGIYIAHRRM